MVSSFKDDPLVAIQEFGSFFSSALVGQLPLTLREPAVVLYSSHFLMRLE